MVKKPSAAAAKAIKQTKARRQATAAKAMENTNGMGRGSSRRTKSTGRLTGGGF